MKDRKNILLAVCFAVSLALYCPLFWIDLNYPRFGSLQSTLMLSFHAVPAFCLQALLCRTAKWNWVKLIPLALFSLVTFVGAMYLSGIWGHGWDALGGALILLWCIAPAAGCCLGWMATAHKIGRWVAAAGWALLLAVYVWLKAMGGPLLHPEPIDLAALIVLAAGLYFLLRKTDKKNLDE